MLVELYTISHHLGTNRSSEQIGFLLDSYLCGCRYTLNNGSPHTLPSPIHTFHSVYPKVKPVAHIALLGSWSIEYIRATRNLGYIDLTTILNHNCMCYSESFGEMDLVQAKSTIERDAVGCLQQFC